MISRLFKFKVKKFKIRAKDKKVFNESCHLGSFDKAKTFTRFILVSDKNCLRQCQLKSKKMN